jgi:hypothetical protein
MGFVYAIGGLPMGLKMGIINGEVLSPSMCEQYLQESGAFLDSNGSCIFNYASCHFIREIDKIDKVFYTSFDTAYKDAREGKLAGVVTIYPNISQSLSRKFSREDDVKTIDPYIDIILDQSNMQLTLFLQSQLFKAYNKFNEKLLGNCSIRGNILSIPMNFSETFYGAVDDDFRATMFPAIILQLSVFNNHFAKRRSQ